MDARALYEKARSAKAYQMVCDDTLLRLCDKAVARFNNEKQALKYVKTQLHLSYGLFMQKDALAQAQRLMEGYAAADLPQRPALLREMIALHASTKARLGYIEEFYRFIKDTLPQVNSVLDMGCGFNPLCIPFMGFKGPLNYHVSDIDIGMMALIRRFFEIEGISGTATPLDLAVNYPTEQSDLALFLQLLPVLEQQQKGLGLQRLGEINCRYAVITFPTKTISGKERGMLSFYSETYEKPLCERATLLAKQVIGSELIYIVQK